jgi:hypothetical protein
MEGSEPFFCVHLLYARSRETFYLQWMLRECDSLAYWQRDAIKAELERRGGDSQQQQRSASAHPPPLDMRGLLARWYREMALTYHPDRTLDNGAAMKAINYAYERLQELLETST